MIKSQIGRPAD